MTLLVDLSNHNAIPDFAALKAGGIAGVIAKVSEGVGWGPDPHLGPLRSGCHGSGLAFGGYHFTRLGDPAAEARWFARCFGPAQPGEFVGLDLEVSMAGVDPVAWTGRWLDAMAALAEPVRLLYLNKTTLAAHDWSPVARRGVRLWLADYDNDPTTPGPAGAFGMVELKQFTDAGTVRGEAGAVDVDALFGALTDLTGGSADMTPDEHAWLQHIYESMTPGIEGVKYDGDGFAVLKWGAWSVLPADSPSGRAEGDVHAAIAKLAAAAGASQPLTLDAASAQLLAAALAADPGFRAGIVADIVAGITADLAKRFATPPPATTA